MPKVTMPPTGIGTYGGGDPIVQVCEELLNDPLELTIASPGFIAFVPADGYKPTPPVGIVFPNKNPIGSYYPKTAGTSIVMSFFDFGTQKLYVTEFNVVNKCPKPEKKKSTKKTKT